MKDPAFLMYSADWISGTSEMSKAAKGCYIDLLCHQHQHGSIPSEPEKIARILGLHNTEFEILWPEISTKWNQKDNRLVNQKLEKVITERKEFAWKRKVLGIYATLLRESGFSKQEIIKIKEAFKLDEFLNINENAITERLTEWLYRMVNHSKDVIVDEDLIKGESEKKDIYSPLSELLKNRILETRQQKITDKTIDQWNNDCRLMVEQDGRTIEQIEQLINECHNMPPTATGFTWKKNILSMSKLREKWNEGKIYIGMNKKDVLNNEKLNFEKGASAKYENM